MGPSQGQHPDPASALTSQPQPPLCTSLTQDIAPDHSALLLDTDFELPESLESWQIIREHLRASVKLPPKLMGKKSD